MLHLDVIEVKAHDEQTVALIERSDHEANEWVIRGHAADQICAVVAKLRTIFSHDAAESRDIFATSRREVLKYQIVSGCFASSTSMNGSTGGTNLSPSFSVPKRRRNLRSQAYCCT